jgi:ligand-binding sensor domain-containing protein/signal transduction histidine kinase
MLGRQESSVAVGWLRLAILHCGALSCFARIAWLLFACCSVAVCSTLPQQGVLVRLPVVKATDLRFTHISFEAGSSHSRVGEIIQDDQGFMWFGTNNGVERNDGYGVRAFRQDPDNPKSLSGSYINALFKDRSGKIWVASDEYLERYDPTTETFTRYPVLAQGMEGWVWDISQDSTGMLWLATHAGLVRLDPATWQTVRYKHRTGDPASLSGDVVTATFEKSDGTFWVATTNGLNVFDRQREKVIQHIPLPQHSHVSLQFESTVNFLEDRWHVLWVSYSFATGLARIDQPNHRLIQYALPGASASHTQLSGVRAMVQGEDGALWLGTANGGLLKLDPNRQRFLSYRNDPRHAQSLSSDQIVALFSDREHNIWVGTTGGGLDRLNYRQPPFKTFQHDVYNPNSLESNYTSAVFKDSHGDLWVGSMKVLTKIDGNTGRFTFFRTAGRPGGLSSTWVISIAEDPAGYLWFGTLGGGLNRYDRRSGRFTVFRHDAANPHSLSHDNVLGLLVDHKGRLWAGTEDGLSAFDAASGRFNVYRPQRSAWFRRYRAIAEDAQGTLWLGSLGGGLQRLNPRSGEFTIYRQASGGLSSDQANAVCVDHSGIVWAGTQNGLNRLDPATGSFTVYYERDGLPSSSINSILEDRRGDLWLSTSNGLSRFSPAAKSFSNYYTSDGLLGNEFYNYANAYKSPGGEMFFNSYAGVIAFFPDQMVATDAPYVPPVVLTGFQLFNKPVPIGSHSPLKQAISFTKSLVLSHAQSIFSFEFSALSYYDPQRSRYRYRLEGLEDTWNETDSRHRFATYTTLPAGRYVFRVQGRTNRGPWSEAGASVQIRILPPWWSTWWLRTLLGVLVVALLVWIYELRLHQLARQFNMRLEERVSERTRIARELHDTLLQSFQGLMLLFQRVRNLLPERPIEAMAAFDDALVRADQAILQGRDAVSNLRTSTPIHNDLAQAVTALGEELGGECGSAANFRVLVEGVPLNVHPILRDEMYCIAREALRNAFHHANARHIEAEIAYGAVQLRLRIRDDGVGIDPKILDQGFRSGHWGMPGMQERAKRIGARLGVWSRPGLGTEIELSIPAALAYESLPGAGGTGLFRKRKVHRP